MKNLDALIKKYTELEKVKTEIEEAYRLFEASYEKGGKLLLCGNGGSSADCAHIAGELLKRMSRPRPLDAKLKAALIAADPDRGAGLAERLEGSLPAIDLSANASFSTAVTNDSDAKDAFAQQLIGYVKPEDTLLAISTSGNSENVIRAAIAAKAMGIKVVGLTGRDGGELKKHCDVCVIAPAYDTPDIQELHVPVYHVWCKELEERFF